MSNPTDGTITAAEALAEALVARDSYTAGHGVRVAELTCLVARDLGVPEDHMATLRLAARLHDIGKIGIPDTILLKPGRLSEAESGLMRTHTQVGRRIIERITGFGPLLAIVEFHHENFDGTGYPLGIKEENIPLLARIVRVTDSFDAMTTDRVYRPAFSWEAAMEELRKGTGRAFDPRVVAAFQTIAGHNAFLESLSAMTGLFQPESAGAAQLKPSSTLRV